MKVETPRRRDASRQTRAHLLAAAKTLFLADGYEATTVRAVAGGAEVTIGAFYGHFLSKRTVLFEVVLAMNALGRGGRLPFTRPAERALILTVASFADSDPKAVETLEAVLRVIAPAGQGGGVDPAAAGALLTDFLT